MLLESPGKIQTPFILPRSPVVRRALCPQLSSQPPSPFYQQRDPRCGWGQALSGGHTTWSESPEGTDVSLSRSVGALDKVSNTFQAFKIDAGSCFS